MPSKNRDDAAPGISDAPVQASTGRTWSEWFAALDAAGAADRDHRGIVALVSEQPGVSLWWRQMVTTMTTQTSCANH